MIYTLGPVAAGMSTKLTVELQSTVKGQVNKEFSIETETEIFKVPVFALVVDENSQ